MGAPTVASWRVCWQLTLEETTGIELSTQKSGCVSNDDDHDLPVMENKSWEHRENIPSRFSHLVVMGAGSNQGRVGVSNRAKEQGAGNVATREIGAR